MRYGRILEDQYSKRQHRSPYVGSPDNLVIRLSIKHHSGWGLGFLARKGPGEAFNWSPATQNYGLAVRRFHWLISDQGRIKILVAGDYAVGYGQGIVLHAGFSVNKSNETVKVMRTNNLGIRPHMAATIPCFRGLTSTWQWKSVELTTYYSSVDLDGQIKSDASVGSFSRHSYYRTPGEISRKGKVNEQVIGSTLLYKGPDRGAELGINMLYSRYSLWISPDLKRGNPLRFRGQHHANVSIFYRYLWKNFHFFGEGALSKNGGKAAIMGVVASLSYHLDATVLWRHYAQDFHSPYGRSFRENSSTNSNERGIYLGIKLTPLRHLHLHAYHDYFYFPWFLGKSRAGYSWLVKSSYQITKTSLVCFQHKTTAKPRRITKSKEVALGVTRNYKFFWQYAWESTIHLKSEIQCGCYQQMGSPAWGYAAAQNITYKKRKLQLKGRIAWFDVTHHYSKLYAYEPNVFHTGFNFRAYQGKGMRYCFLMCYQLTNTLRLELKYALTHCKDKKETGSGKEAIKSNFENEVMLQIIFKF